MTGVIKAITLLLVVGGSLFIGAQIDFEHALDPAHVAAWLQSLGPWGPLILIVSMATAVIIPPIPSLPLDLASGAAFGPLLGTTYAVIGAAVGAMVSFSIGRALGREGISRLLRVDAVFCEKCSDYHAHPGVFLRRGELRGVVHDDLATDLLVRHHCGNGAADIRLHVPGEFRGFRPMAVDRVRLSLGRPLRPDADVAPAPSIVRTGPIYVRACAGCRCRGHGLHRLACLSRLWQADRTGIECAHPCRIGPTGSCCIDPAGVQDGRGGWRPACSCPRSASSSPTTLGRVAVMVLGLPPARPP